MAPPVRIYDNPHTINVEAWDRQRGETAQAYEGFAMYRDMGLGRSLHKVCAQTGKSYSLISRWSSRWKWAERSRAWDNHESQAIQDAMKIEAGKVARRHANMASQHMTALMAPLVELSRRAGADGKVDLSSLSVPDLVKLVQRNAAAIRALVDVERLSHGMSTIQVATAQVEAGGESMLDALRQVFAVIPEATGPAPATQPPALPPETETGTPKGDAP